MSKAAEELAKILRADKDDLLKIESRLSEVTDAKGVMEKLVEKRDAIVADRLKQLGLEKSAAADEVYIALLKKAKLDSSHFEKYLGNPTFNDTDGYNKVLKIVRDKSAAPKLGLFLKKEKAMEFLKKEPPQKVMDFLGYSSVDEMCRNEDLLEIYSSLRFIEDRAWMNNVFFKQYDNLTPDDFEEREIELRVLDKKWAPSAQGFLDSKWHNVSHLKELGFIFVIPATLGVPGEVLRTVGLVSHYLYEVPFYSDMFKKISQSPSMFSENLASLLRGDIIDRKLPQERKTLWLVVQRYLTKEDPNDWRLFAPHLNPEAFHYLRSVEALVRIGEEMEEADDGLSFWENTDWVGDFFKDDSGNEIFVSFDLIDNAFGLVKEEEKIRFDYHVKESLWNRIFIEYFGRKELEYFLKEYLLQGYFEV